MLKSPESNQNEIEPNLSYWELTKVVWSFLQGRRAKYLSFFILLGIAESLGFPLAYLLGLIASFFIKYKMGDNLTFVYQIVFVYGIIQILTAVLRLTSKNQLARIGIELVSEVQRMGIQKLVEFPLDWHQKENSGNKIQRLQTGTNAFRQLLSTVRGLSLQQFINIVTPTVIFLFVDWRLLLLFVVSSIYYFVINKHFDKKIVVLEKQINKLKENQGGTLFEVSSNIVTTKSLNAESSITKSTFNIEDEIVKLRQQARNIANYKWLFFQVYAAFTVVIFLLILIDKVTHNIASAGFILVYYTYFSRYDNAVKNLFETIGDLQEQKEGVARMMPIFNETPDVYFGKDKFPINWQSIELKEANFVYPNKSKSERPHSEEIKKSLEKLDFIIKKGEKLGIVGRSGSGKSTLAKLLIGLYKLEQGSFEIVENDSKTNYYDISHQEITQKISIVLQETELFNMTFLENLTLLKETESEKVHKAIEIAQLESVIAKLPKGLDTKLGEKGYKLSGGEKQRVGIARAICSGAELLILDEATSALDSKTELAIQEALENNLQDKTLILIAHRLSTLRNVDRIIVFEDGKIIEQGNFSELINDQKSKFSELWKLQQNQSGESL